MALAKPAQKPSTLLDRDVQCGEHLVAEQQVGPHDQRAGDGDTLALTAGKLIRKARGISCIKSGIR
jgi:hypothetical protein